MPCPKGKGKRPSQGVALREELVGGEVKAVQGEGQDDYQAELLQGE